MGALPYLHTGLDGLGQPCVENGLVGGDWKREKEKQETTSAFPGEGVFRGMSRAVKDPNWSSDDEL